METQKTVSNLTRRQFLHNSGKVALVASLSGLVFVRTTKAASTTTGSLVIVSQAGAAPDKALPKALKEFEAANPGMTTKLVLYPQKNSSPCTQRPRPPVSRSIF